jgi:formate dehydrogenase (coenzyme F420) beta subunit
MNNLHQIVQDLFTSGKADLVLGYEKGTGDRRRPAIIKSAGEVEKLVFDEKCSHNLSVYLTHPEYKLRHHIVLFTTATTLRSVVRLAGENQLAGKNLTFILNRGDNAFEMAEGIEALLDHARPEGLVIHADPDELISRLDKMTREERFSFWKDQFSNCMKCYACRAACPVCYCTACTVEINQPQWITVPSSLAGNFEWHIMRMMHMAGRCVDCGACEAACPVGIPLNMITRNIIREIENNFGTESLSLQNRNVLNTFQPADKENFIK